MKITALAVIFVIIGSAVPAFATKYYVVQNSKTLKCSVVPKKPKGKTVVLVGGGTPYKTRSDARATFGPSQAVDENASLWLITANQLRRSRRKFFHVLVPGDTGINGLK